MVGQIAKVVTGCRWRWLFGPQVDVAFFLLPWLVGVIAYTFMQSPQFFQTLLFSIIVADSFEAGPFHQGPTLFAYFDKSNREYFGNDRKRRVIFYLAPPLIIVVSILLFHWSKELVTMIWMLWAIQHFIQQNIGILLLYHNHNQGEVVVSRSIEMRSQWCASLFFFGIFWQRVMVPDALNPLLVIWIGTALIGMLYYCTLYLRETTKQLQSGSYLNAPAMLFWVMSIFAFVPLAFLGHGFYDAYLIPTTVHFFQYIGLNFVLVKNKYGTELVGNLPWKQPILLLTVACCVLVSINIGLALVYKQAELPAFVRDGARGALLGVAFCHFFLDAFIWRFRDQHQRANILPYLKPARTAVS
jgi:hypothetical protein